MHRTIIFLSCLLLSPSLALAEGCQGCCADAGGIFYCDASAGRYVCQNGDFSPCYCTRHAVMDLQKMSLCCLWKGGVVHTTTKGHVVCRDGSVSELCSKQNYVQHSSMW